MPETVKSNIKMVIVVCCFLVTIFTGGVGYGQLSTKVSDTGSRFIEHCANQTGNEKALTIALNNLNEMNVELRTEVKNLKEIVTELKQEIRRMR